MKRSLALMGIVVSLALCSLLTGCGNGTSVSDSEIEGKWYSTSVSEANVLTIHDGTYEINGYRLQLFGDTPGLVSDNNPISGKYKIKRVTESLLKECTPDESLWASAVAVLELERPTGVQGQTYLIYYAILDDGSMTSDWMRQVYLNGDINQGGAWHRDWAEAVADPYLSSSSYGCLTKFGYVSAPV